MTAQVHERKLVRDRTTPIVLAVVVLALVGLAWWRGGPDLALTGLVHGGETLLSVAPWLVLAFLLAFLIAGPIQTLVQQETVTRWLGTEAGWRGIALGCLAGALFPSGPYAYYPVAGALLQAGASLGVLVAFIAAKNLWSVTRLPPEFALLGPRLTLIRFVVTLILPPLLEFLAEVIFGPHIEPIRGTDGSHWRSVAQGRHSLWRTLSLLVVAFVIVGYGEVLMPQDLVQTWIGPASGWRGLLLAEGAGMLLPGGPYVVFPLVAVLYQAGAGVGPTVTLVASSAMLALPSVPFELPFMGWRFAVTRWGLGLAFPLLAGSVAQLIFGGPL